MTTNHREPFRAVRNILLVCAALLVAGLVPTGQAGERVRFRNGHTMDVEKSRVEGDVLYLTLPEGGEIGVPRSLVAEIESGHRVASRRRGSIGFSPRSIPFDQLPGAQRAMRERDGGAPLSMRVKVPSGQVKAGQRMTVGYRYKDSIDVSELGRAQSSGPVVALWDRQNAPVAGEGYRSSAKPRPGRKKNPPSGNNLLPRVKNAGEKDTAR
ncbi:MAG: hypothetical protein Kow0062_18190 [Acidobacteriota bacterium]